MEVVKNGQKAEKKPTNAQLQRRIQNAIVHMERTKDTKEVYFDDRALRIIVNEDMALMQNGIYTTIFQRYGIGGESSQYTSLRTMVELAEKYKDKILVKDKQGEVFRSFSALEKTVEEENDENRAWFTVMSWYIFNVEANFALAPRHEFTNAVFYGIYEKYAHTASALEQYMKEHAEAMTNRQYFYAIADKMKEIADGMPEDVMFAKKTDEERMQEEMKAMQEDFEEKVLNEQIQNAEQPTDKR